ncbi:hypothetical protein J2X20_003998 [Pelomonas saccharophila]|uniref:YrdC-like domain-containing protein n=1 Tax=Roseateles saccharophilus TaxID=304 RepID=A0ABU1YR45_ROSSA|nr:Sua5/YciO/YrdC/YwlC family protein [Roseateles saccharophilus]MDR7271330.1 hypothetical protein [Roseateles saccharophilus]
MSTRPFLRCEVHPDNPQGRQLQVVAERLRAGAIAAVPTASGYLLTSRFDDKAAAARLLHRVDERLPVMLLCRDLAQAAAFMRIDDSAFRTIREARRGSAAFLLRCTHRVPRRLAAGAGGHALLYFAGHAAGHGLLEQLEDPLLALAPPDGLRELDQLTVDSLALLDVALDAGPLSEPQPIEYVELVQPARAIARLWTQPTGDICLAA